MGLAERGRALGRRGIAVVALIALVLTATLADPVRSAAAAPAHSNSQHVQHARTDRADHADRYPGSHWAGLASGARLAHAVDAADPVVATAPPTRGHTQLLAGQPQAPNAHDSATVEARAPPVEGTA